MKNIVQKVSSLVRQGRIQEQIFLSMLLVTMIITLVLGNLAYYVSKTTIEDNYAKSHIYTLKNSSKILDLQVEKIVEISRSVLDNNTLMKILKADAKENGGQFDTDDNITLRRIAGRLLTQDNLIYSIAFLDLQGRTFFYRNNNAGQYLFYQYYAEHDYMEEEWVSETIKNKGKELFYGMGVAGGEQYDNICFTKYLINPANQEPVGFMVVEINKKILANSFAETSQGYSTNNYMILNPKSPKVPVYYSGNKESEMEIMENYSRQQSQNKYLFSKVINSSTGWELLNIIEKNELSKESQYIRDLMLYVEVGILFLSFFIARFLSRGITKPLHQLEKTIESVGEGKRHISEHFNDSEVGQIGQKFKEMVNNNLELSEHLLTARLNEREAELLLLQSQINPHFLYNTLDSLYCLAIIHGDDQIAEMTLALSDTFKISLNNGEKFITVADSIKRIEAYMKLQNMRYHDRFDLLLDIQPEIMGERIISFILQPFVENAMYHGLEPKIGRGSIQMKGKKEGGELRFQIVDDGVGIKDLSAQDKGYGIRNVRERIKLTYGEGYGVTVESRHGEGTTVTIVIPLQREGEKNAAPGGD